MPHFETKTVPIDYDNLAPDGSEIRLLQSTTGGGMVHCVLPVGGISKPIYHHTIEEMWYFLDGNGQVWRKFDEEEEVVDVYAGVSLNIPVKTHFQFRNTGDTPLQFIIANTPPWRGPEEVVMLEQGKWDVS